MNNLDLFTEIAYFIGFPLYFCIGILREGDGFGEERQLRIGRTPVRERLERMESEPVGRPDSLS